MARVTFVKSGRQHVRNVKNLGWFFKQARTVEITRFDMWKSNDGWEMFVDFADGKTFQTHYADLTVFKHFMGRQRSLRGVVVTIHDSNGDRTLTLGCT
jgi:hypothetical protein